MNHAFPSWQTILEGLSPDEINAIQDGGQRKRLAAGSNLYRQGEYGDRFYIIQSGRVRTTYYSEQGKAYVSGIWPAGYVLGIISALLEHERLQSADGVGVVVVDVVARSDLVALMARFPVFGLNVARLMAQLARYSITRSGPLALDSAAHRLGRVLLLAAQPDPAGPPSLHVRGLTQEDLAHMTGASRPWVAKILASLEAEGLIIRHRGAVTIVDGAAFERYLSAAGATLAD